jgi:hypothetical protein
MLFQLSVLEGWKTNLTNSTALELIIFRALLVSLSSEQMCSFDGLANAKAKHLPKRINTNRQSRI